MINQLQGIIPNLLRQRIHTSHIHMYAEALVDPGSGDRLVDKYLILYNV
jgi:hypothetical protein